MLAKETKRDSRLLYASYFRRWLVLKCSLLDSSVQSEEDLALLSKLQSLKVPKREIFDRSDFPDFYTIKSLRVGDFGVKIKKKLQNI